MTCVVLVHAYALVLPALLRGMNKAQVLPAVHNG
jgi:hypothetical protein